MWLLIFVCLLFSGQVAGTFLEISVQDTSDPLIHLESFGFLASPGGHLEMSVIQLETTASVTVGVGATKWPMGFTLERGTRLIGARLGQWRRQGCFANRYTGQVVALLPTMQPPTTSPTKTIHLHTTNTHGLLQSIDMSTDIQQEGLYSLYFFNCNPNTTATFRLQLHQYNTIDGTPSYLSLGDRWLDLVTGLMAIVCLAFAGLWGHLLHLRREGVEFFHRFMLLIVLLYTDVLIWASIYYHQLDTHGVVALPISLLYHVPRVLMEVALLVFITLVASGACRTTCPAKPNRSLLVAVCLLALIANVCWVFVDTQAPGSSFWTPARRLWRLASGLAHLLSIMPLFCTLFSTLQARVLAGCCYCFCSPCTALYTTFKGATHSTPTHRHAYLLCSLVMSHTFLVSLSVGLQAHLEYDRTWIAHLVFYVTRVGFLILLAVALRPLPPKGREEVEEEEVSDAELAFPV
eukprot:NODE_1588_length_1449_cov_38.673979_g1506_i0.p1 GENE.NODE_1588_length_1449_cov_38.673979_g1506_i0~~NODE_1588_length_1449_cov_38.673979_g1506_i0.p1  ORF type:complete len:463 (+),score=107.95 NODE_1588_length_1449_cov_38.673979_g1506_i0:3-1391(+)